MPMTLNLNLIIRNAQPQDQPEVTRVLAGALAEAPTLRWLHPDPVTRGPYAVRHAAAVVDDAFTHGTVRVADHGGTPIAAALWVRHPATGRPADPTPRGTSEEGPDAEVNQRLQLLHRLLEPRHPGTPHEHLTGLGVDPGWQNTGLRAYLLTDRHHTLAELGLPACIDVDDPALRQWCRTHDYLDLDIGDPITLPDGQTRIWRMRRAPTTVTNCTS